MQELRQQDLAGKINKTQPLVRQHVEQTGKVNHQTLLLISRALDMNLDDIEAIVNEPKKGKSKTKISEFQEEVSTYLLSNFVNR